MPIEHAGLIHEIRALVTAHGPVSASQVNALYDAVHPRTRTGWGWNWSVAKRVLEYLFFGGELMSARRSAAFERCYDMTERVLPATVLTRPEPTDADAVRALVEISARAHGIGSLRCLADGQARLSPFDPLLFERRRVEELFGLRYRIEIYVPAAQRVRGYYVLPFLLVALVALVDLKADRQAGILRGHAAHRVHPGPDRTCSDVPAALAAELRLLADWLGLGEITVGTPGAGPVGDLASTLVAAPVAAGSVRS